MAQSTSNVVIDDPVYRDIDKLIAAGLVHDVIFGQRPWNEREIKRIFATALKNRQAMLAKTPGQTVSPFWKYIDGIFERHEGTVHRAKVRPLEKIWLDYTLLNSPSRPVRVANGIGSVRADINPLIAYEEGRHFADGDTFALETAHQAELSRFFSAYLRPRLEFTTTQTGIADVTPFLQQGYFKFAYKNFEVQVGRDSLIWGQGVYGGLVFSNNARPLDMMKITTSAPFYHPWIFRHLGLSKYTFFIGNLGPESDIPYTFIYGFRASIRPAKILELGFDQVLFIGGEGSPSINFFDPIGEFFFLRRGGLRGGVANVTDRRFGLDLRLRIPPFRNMEWYFETMWDDFARETLHVNFTEQMGFVTGLYFPSLLSDGSLDVRLEYTRIPPILYRHGIWTSGHALNQRLLGSEVGPDGDQIQITLRKDLKNQAAFQLNLVYENQDNDTYTQSNNSTGGVDRVIKVDNNLTEHRWRIEGECIKLIRKNVNMNIKLGYERVQNFNFNVGDDADNFLISTGITYNLSYGR